MRSFFIYLLIFSPFKAIVGAKKYKSVSSNIAKFQNKKYFEYHEEFDYVKKLYLNKFSLINAAPIKPTPSDKAIMFLWQEPLRSLSRQISESMTSIKKLSELIALLQNVCYYW